MTHFTRHAVSLYRSRCLHAPARGLHLIVVPHYLGQLYVCVGQDFGNFAFGFQPKCLTAGYVLTTKVSNYYSGHQSCWRDYETSSKRDYKRTNAAAQRMFC